MPGKLAGKVALVTGAGSGIGKASALMLAKEGAKICALSRTLQEVQQTEDEVKAAGGDAFAIEADISVPSDMETAVRKTVDRYGRLDIVFANAGMNGVWAPLEELTPEDWDRTLDSNLKGTFLTIKYAAPYLKRQGGSIIVTASVNGTRIFSNTGATAYSSSKAGQVALTKMVALELARDKVRVNVICPGAVETQIEDNTTQKDLKKIRQQVKYPQGSIPLTGGKPGQPEQVAQLVLFLASDESSLITGTEIWIDGGESLLEG